MPKLNHKKSRNGCTRCKARKVKCDEIRPSCSQCSRHGVQCAYEDMQIRFVSGLASQGSSASESTSRSPLRRSDFGSPGDAVPYRTEDQLLELRLMHHYAQEVCHSLFSSCATEAWQLVLPGMAWQYPFLLDALMSLSALHLARFSNEAELFKLVFAKYFARTLASHRLAIVNVTRENAPATTLAMSMINFQTFVQVSDDDFSRGYRLPTLWLQTSTGTANIVGMWGLEVALYGPLVELYHTIPEILPPRNACFNAELRTPFESSPAWPPYTGAEEEYRDTYEKVMSFLGLIHCAMEKQFAATAIARRMMALMPKVPRDFVGLVERHDSRALAAFGHLFSLVSIIEDHNPWLRGIARPQIEGIKSLLAPEWWPAVDRPMPHWSPSTAAPDLGGVSCVDDS